MALDELLASADKNTLGRFNEVLLKVLANHEEILNIMLPSKTKNKIPYLCLIDLDKAISYDENKYCFTLKKEFFGNTKEALMYRGKKEKTQHLKHQRIRIESMTKKLPKVKIKILL